MFFNHFANGLSAFLSAVSVTEQVLITQMSAAFPVLPFNPFSVSFLAGMMFGKIEFTP